MSPSTRPLPLAINTPGQVLFASLIGTTIEFFDFYIYATAAVLVFPRLFFPASDPASATLASLATFAHRVRGAADRLGALRPLRRPHRPQDDARRRAADDGRLDGGDRRAADLRRRIGVAAPLLLALCRFGQGLGLGGEWGGAVLLAIENAPPGKRAWYGMFPQLGAPIGFFFSGGVFLLLSRVADRRAVLRVRLAHSRSSRAPCSCSSGSTCGSRSPRRRSSGTPLTRSERVKVPMLVVFRDHPGTLVLGTLSSLATFVLFYLMTVFALSWGTTALGYTPRAVPADPALRHSLLRADDSDLRGARRARPPPHAHLGDGRHRAVRLVMAPMFVAARSARW